MYAAQIENGDHEKNRDANRDGVSLQRRGRGNESADSGGDADGGGKNVIGEERSCREKTGERTKIRTRHGVGAAAGRIGGDSL